MAVQVDNRYQVPDSQFEVQSEFVGEQVPPIMHVPEWEWTAGDDVIDLAEAIGENPIPWQKLVTRNACSENPLTGKWNNFQVGLVVPRQNGKNFITRIVELAHLFVFGTEKIVHTAHLFKTAHNEYLELKKIIERVPELMDQVRSMPDSKETAIILKDGRRIDFLARANASGRGLQGDLVILDEAFALSETLVADLLPVLSARKNAQVWYTSSTGFDYSTVLKNVRDQAMQGDKKHLAYFEWSADLKQVSWDSVEAVQASNPSLGYTQSWDWIHEVELGVMPEEAYQRERLGVWADNSSDAAIGVDRWARGLATPEALVGSKVVKRSLALEVTPDRDMAFLAGVALLKDGRVVGDIVAAREGVAWIQDEAKRVAKKHKPVAGIVVDAFSGAASVAMQLANAGIEVSLASTKDLTRATEELFDRLVFEDEGVADPQFLHSSHPLLDDAAHTARRRLVGTSQSAWTWKQFGEVRVEPLRAMTLALAGLSMEPVGKQKRRKGRVA